MGDIRFDKLITNENQIAYDLDWFGVDRDGLIGHFATGGIAPIPKSVVDDNQGRLTLLHYFSNTLVNTTSIRVLSVVGKRLAFGVDGFFASYDSMSMRGLFAYRAQDTGVPPIVYVLATKPMLPIHVSALPDKIAQIISGYVLTVSLAKTNTIVL